MKKLGIIGGIGWPSTIEYYRLICEASQRYHSNQHSPGPAPMPEMVIESLDINFAVNNRGTSEAGSWDAWDLYFNQAMKRLEASGAELIVIASVTPHARLKEVSRGINVPVLSIYDAIGAYCSKAGVERLLVLGTMPTMTSPAFQINMEPFNLNVLFPPDKALKIMVTDTIHRLYQNDIAGTGEAIEQIVRASVPEHELQTSAVCLGCTELPLAFPEYTSQASFRVNGIMYINTSVVHTSFAFQECTATADAARIGG